MPDRRRRGLETQEMFAEYLQRSGWPGAESAPRGHKGRDVTGLPGLRVEVKARREFRPGDWLRQAEAGMIGPPGGRGVIVELPLVVFRPDGMGPATIRQWGMLLRVEHGVSLLRSAGWGEPMPTIEEYLLGEDQ